MSVQLFRRPGRSSGEPLSRRPSPIAPAPPPRICTTGSLFVRQDAAGDTLIALRGFEAGEAVFTFDHVVWRLVRDRQTVEDPRGRHVYDPLLARMAHSCDPNCRPCFQLMAMVARRAFAPGDTLTFDYLSTESAIAEPFDCRCGAANCRGRIQRAEAAQAL
jgi:uncharacterized protein